MCEEATMEHELRLERAGPAEWILPREGSMRVPGRIYADPETIGQLEEDVRNRAEWNALVQVRNVAALPGIVDAALALPDVHPGYGFPIGGVGAFDLDEGVVVRAAYLDSVDATELRQGLASGYGLSGIVGVGDEERRRRIGSWPRRSGRFRGGGAIILGETVESPFVPPPAPVPVRLGSQRRVGIEGRIGDEVLPGGRGPGADEDARQTGEECGMMQGPHRAYRFFSVMEIPKLSIMMNDVSRAGFSVIARMYRGSGIGRCMS